MLAEDITLRPVSLGDDRVDLFLLDLTGLSDPDEVARWALGPRERLAYERLARPARRREWLGARLCAKAIVRQRHPGASFGECEVLADAAGRPRLWFSGRDADVVYDCSLSHAESFACAGGARVAGQNAGVDIERVSSRVLRLEGAFARDCQAGLESYRPDQRLTVLWSLKEACVKAMGEGIGAVLATVVCESLGEGFHRLRTPEGVGVVARHVLYRDHAVAMCVNEPRKGC